MQQMLDQVRAGKTVFFKSGDEWLIMGPADKFLRERPIGVTKRDGSTVRGEIGDVLHVGEKQGVRYATARFIKYAPERYTGTERYSAGASEYRFSDLGLAGRQSGTVQIWDQS